MSKKDEAPKAVEQRPETAKTFTDTLVQLAHEVRRMTPEQCEAFKRVPEIVVCRELVEASRTLPKAEDRVNALVVTIERLTSVGDIIGEQKGGK